MDTTKSSGSHDHVRKVSALAILPDGFPIPQCVSGLQHSDKAEITTIHSEKLPAELEMLRNYDVTIIVASDGQSHRQAPIDTVLTAADDQKLLCMILGDDPALADELREMFDGLPRVCWCPADASEDELYGRLCLLADYRGAFQRIDRQLGQLEHWAAAMNSRFEELHQELQLAWRVQRDFLPKTLPQTDDIKFATVYRPANWVSGDIYDVFQLDESHFGFYIADVVGHGVAAGLLTLFVKRAMVTKETSGSSYRLVPPSEVMGKLNNDLCDLELPEQQFLTACYGVIDCRTRELTVARGGHPLPILMEKSNRLSQLDVTGPLLGVFHDGEFDDLRMQLSEGDKIVLISDGVEQAFEDNDPDGRTVVDHLRGMCSLGSDDMLESLEGMLHCQESSLHPADDITMVVAELLS